MDPLRLILIAWAAMALAMTALYLVERRTRNAGWVDVGWTFGVALAAGFYAWFGYGDPGRRVLLAALAGLWGLRLGLYLLVRVASEPEDGRYQMLRRGLGDRTALGFFVFFQIQAFWVVMFAAPFLPVAFHKAPLLAWWDVAAICVWLVSVGGESLADAQLARFRAKPESRGRTCREGLWRYSRHPNYFFEWLHWFTYILLAIGSPYFWVTLAGPVLMFVFLYKVTGIPYTEKRSLESRGEDYRSYQRTTSAFIPWFPKKEQTP